MTQTNPRLMLMTDLDRELARNDSIGRQERRAAVFGMLTALDTLERLSLDSLDNFRLLRALLNDDFNEGDEHEADDGTTIFALLEVIGTEGFAYTRLVNKIYPEVRQVWDKHDEEIRGMYQPLTMADDPNLKGLEGCNLEARCGKCGQTFVPDSESFVGMSKMGEGLYEHYLTIRETFNEFNTLVGTEEIACGGYGTITGGYKGMDRVQKGTA